MNRPLASVEFCDDDRVQLIFNPADCGTYYEALEFDSIDEADAWLHAALDALHERNGE